jgi:hypothetical protein
MELKDEKNKVVKTSIYLTWAQFRLALIDGYDKLIHCAIDGFSRGILWLEMGPSNNNPQIIACYFFDTVL